MSKWDKLLVEVLELIVDALGDESRYRPLYGTKYMLVKKQWLDVFLRRYYKSVWLDLVPTCKTIQKILYLPFFKPGTFVKKISFGKLKAPDNFPDIDIKQDFLWNTVPTLKKLKYQQKWKKRMIGNICQLFSQETLVGNFSLLELTIMNAVYSRKISKAIIINVYTLQETLYER